jgi:DNA polymerase-3 subunit delta
MNQVQQASFHLKPVFLIYGDEPLFVRDSMDGLRQRLLQLGFEADEVYEVDAAFDWRGFEFDVTTDSLFSRQRFIVLNVAKGSLGKEGTSVLEKWLHQVESAPIETVLIIRCERLDAKQLKAKWIKLVEGTGLVVQAKTVPANAVPKWLMERANVYQLILEFDAAQILAERIQGNLLAADQELEKLALLNNEQEVVNAQNIQDLVFDQAHFQLFALSSTLLKGDVAKSVQMYQRLRQEGIEIPVVLWLLNKEVRQLDELVQRAKQTNLAKAFDACRIWKSRQMEYREALGRAQPKFWRHCLADLARIDLLAKGMRAKLSDQQIENEMVQIITAIAQGS